MIGKSRIKAEAIVFVTALAVFSSLPNADQGMDSYIYAINIRDSSELLHPHHLLYNVLGVILLRLFSFTGLGSLQILSFFNSAIGAAVLTIIYRAVRIHMNFRRATAAVVSLGALYSFWYYSTSVEVNMAALLFGAMAVLLILGKKDSSANGAAASFIIATGTLFHQALVLMYIPLFIVLYHRRKSVAGIIGEIGPAIFALIAVYFTCAIISAPDHTAKSAWRWLTLYSHLGPWGKLSPDNFVISIWGITKVLFGGDEIRRIVYAGGGRPSDYLYMFLLVSGASILLFAAVGSLLKRSSLTTFELFLLSNSIVFGLFAFWWAPTDDGFWLYSIAPMVLLIFVRSARLGSYIRLLTAFPIILILANYPFEIIPSVRAENSIVRSGAAKLAVMNLGESDLVITNFNQIRLALDYHHGLKTNTACLLFAPAGENDAVIREYSNQIHDWLTRGRVLIFADEISPEPHRRYLTERFSLDDYRRAYGRFLQMLVRRDSVLAYGSWVTIWEISRDSIGLSAESSDDH